MAPTESPSNRHVPLLQFVIALMLVKSKPRSLSSPDFCKQLVSLIKEGPRSKRSTQADAHIDTTAFWRNRSTGLEEENAALKAQVSGLQLSKVELLAKVADLEAREAARLGRSVEVEDSARSQRLKRTKDGEPAEGPSARSSKRARTKAGGAVTDGRDALQQDVTDDGPESEMDELRTNLLDSLRVLQGTSIATNRHQLGPKDLAIQLSSIAVNIGRYVSVINLLADSTTRSKKRKDTRPEADIEEVIEQQLIPLGRIIPHFLSHLHTLSQFSRSGNLYGKVVYEFINVFRVLFQHICDLAIADAKSSQDNPKTVKQQDDGRNKQCATSASDGRPYTSPIILILCKLAISMLSYLDPMLSTHKAILEGCLYLLVFRVGKVLKEFTVRGMLFGIHEDDARSSHNLRTREREQVNVPSVACDTEASEAEAPYLIWMLSRALRLSSSTSFATKIITTARKDHWGPRITQQESIGNGLYEDARIRLQHTLVRALFGERFADSFEPALEPPLVPPDDDLRTGFDAQTEKADVGDWFKNEVWRLVGWDVLRGNTSWD